MRWTTWPLSFSSFTAVSVKEALIGLPNQAIPSVATSETITGTTAREVRVTFSDTRTPGDQAALAVDSSGCAINGCQPKHAGKQVTADTIAVTTVTGGTTENSACANRGECDSESGLCQCFKGYYGEACEKQTIIQ